MYGSYKVTKQFCLFFVNEIHNIKYIQNLTLYWKNKIDHNKLLNYTIFICKTSILI